MRIIVRTLQGSFLNVEFLMRHLLTFSPVRPNFDRKSLIQEHTAS